MICFCSIKVNATNIYTMNFGKYEAVIIEKTTEVIGIIEELNINRRASVGQYKTRTIKEASLVVQHKLLSAIRLKEKADKPSLSISDSLREWAEIFRFFPTFTPFPMTAYPY